MIRGGVVVGRYTELEWVKGNEEHKKKKIFFYKQKTAYEICSGDWSSDVCSSDLCGLIRYLHSGLCHWEELRSKAIFDGITIKWRCERAYELGWMGFDKIWKIMKILKADEFCFYWQSVNLISVIEFGGLLFGVGVFLNTDFDFFG